MNVEALLHQWDRNAERIRQLCLGIPEEQGRWKPDPTSWSILEVVNHLYDEEREDFRVRLDIILHRSQEPWPPIDPEGWVVARGYNGRDLDSSLAAFLAEREHSLAWLRSLGPVDWQASSDAPWGGTIRAGDMFASWVSHDGLHMRQLAELHLAYTVHQARPCRVEYSGI